MSTYSSTRSGGTTSSSDTHSSDSGLISTNKNSALINGTTTTAVFHNYVIQNESALSRAYRTIHAHRRPITRKTHFNPAAKLNHYDYIPRKVVYKESVQLERDRQRTKLKLQLMEAEEERHQEALELERQLMEAEGMDFDQYSKSPRFQKKRRGTIFFQNTQSGFDYEFAAPKTVQLRSKSALSPEQETKGTSRPSSRNNQSRPTSTRTLHSSRPSSTTNHPTRINNLVVDSLNHNRQTKKVGYNSRPKSVSKEKYFLTEPTIAIRPSSVPRPSITTVGRLFQTIQLAVERKHTPHRDTNDNTQSNNLLPHDKRKAASRSNPMSISPTAFQRETHANPQFFKSRNSHAHVNLGIGSLRMPRTAHKHTTLPPIENPESMLAMTE